MTFIELLVSMLFGLVEGITEWLPISSTGHMILLDEFIKISNNKSFTNMFLVVVQLGAILAVVVIFWNKIFPFKKKEGKLSVDMGIMDLWFHIVVATLPAVVASKFDDWFEENFYSFQSVATVLIIYGVFFIAIEVWNKNRKAKVNSIKDLTYTAALIIGLFQVLAVVPGTSRSGATIIGALLIGISRTVAAEFTFYLAIPVMFGASLLKLKDFGFAFATNELLILIVGMVTAFVVSLFVIKFLMSYIKKHDFKVFGYYRIVLGIILLVYQFGFR